MRVEANRPGLKLTVDHVVLNLQDPGIMGDVINFWAPTGLYPSLAKDGCCYYAQWLRCVTRAAFSLVETYSEVVKIAGGAPFPAHPHTLDAEEFNAVWGPKAMLEALSAMSTIPPTGTIVCFCPEPHCWAQTLGKAVDYLDLRDPPYWHNLRREHLGSVWLRGRPTPVHRAG